VENTKAKNQNQNYVRPAYLVKTLKKTLFGFRIMKENGWLGKKGKYKTMKKIKCPFCFKNFYNNGFSTHEYYCKRKHQDIFTNCERVIVY